MESKLPRVAAGKHKEPGHRGSQNGLGGKHWDRGHRATGTNITPGFASAVCRQGDQGHSGTMTVGPQKSPAEGEGRSPDETSLPLLSNL